MEYYINPAQLSAMFAMPAAVADKHLKLADLNQLRVLIYVMRHSAEAINPEIIAKALGISEENAEDALLFWVQCEILGSNAATPSPAPKKEKAVVIKTEKPGRADVARRGSEDVKIRMLLSGAQAKFGRNIKDNEARTLVWLYDDCGMDVSVILMLLQYAKSKDKCNIRFVEKTAQDWLKDGIETISDAEEYIACQAKAELSWSIVNRTFGLDKRTPSAKEQAFATLWIDTWGFSAEIIKEAYDVCVDATGQVKFPYISKTLENWHKQGAKSLDTVKVQREKKEGARAPAKASYAGYDISALEELINK